ncbi:MAG: hypothetical protein NC405_05410 [Odoribacter sp.]|nr:hypothetical protein [Odoribacter sp.]
MLFWSCIFAVYGQNLSRCEKLYPLYTHKVTDGFVEGVDLDQLTPGVADFLKYYTAMSVKIRTLTSTWDIRKESENFEGVLREYASSTLPLTSVDRKALVEQMLYVTLVNSNHFSFVQDSYQMCNLLQWYSRYLYGGRIPDDTILEELKSLPNMRTIFEESAAKSNTLGEFINNSAKDSQIFAEAAYRSLVKYSYKDYNNYF